MVQDEARLREIAEQLLEGLIACPQCHNWRHWREIVCPVCGIANRHLSDMSLAIGRMLRDALGEGE